MSIATELTTLNETKQAIKQSLINKGVDLTGVNFAGYSAKIDALSTGGGNVSSSEWSQAYYDSVLANSWTRNPNWLAMPTLTTKGFVGLMGIYDTDNEVCTVKVIGGSYTVDWGDGTVEDFSSDTIASHIYTFANISSATTQADGSRQVIVKAYPQAGQQFTSIDLSNKHARYTSAYETNWLDIWLSTNSSDILPILSVNGNATQLVYLNELERFTWVSDGFTGTSMAYMFAYSRNLQNITLPDTAAVTNMSYMFQNCNSLQTIPLLDTASVTNMNGMFASCYSLQTIPLLNTASVTNMSYMFQNCYSLQTIPLMNTVSVTNMSSMFQNCNSLQTIPLLNTASVTNMSYMFQNCNSLQTLALSSANANTNTSSMFSGCRTLSRIRIPDMKKSFSVASCGLSATALDEIYTNLPTVTGQTITVTGNFGTASDNPSIATAKGWTVTG